MVPGQPMVLPALVAVLVIAATACGPPKSSDQGASAEDDAEAAGDEPGDVTEFPSQDVPTYDDCSTSTPILRDGNPTGYVRCADGAVNRDFVVPCADVLALRPDCTGDEDAVNCASDDSCVGTMECRPWTRTDGSSFCGCV